MKTLIRLFTILFLLAVTSCSSKVRPIYQPMYETTRVLDAKTVEVSGYINGKIPHTYLEILFTVKLVKIVHQPEIVSIHTDQLVQKGDLVRIVRPVHFLGEGWDTQVYLDGIVERKK